MKILLVCATIALFAVGCAAPTKRSPTAHLDPRPAGTEAGTSFPGVNQGTTDTTATRSNDTYH